MGQRALINTQHEKEANFARASDRHRTPPTAPTALLRPTRNFAAARIVARRSYHATGREAYVYKKCKLAKHDKQILFAKTNPAPQAAGTTQGLHAASRPSQINREDSKARPSKHINLDGQVKKVSRTSMNK